MWWLGDEGNSWKITQQITALCSVWSAYYGHMYLSCDPKSVSYLYWCNLKLSHCIMGSYDLSWSSSEYMFVFMGVHVCKSVRDKAFVLCIIDDSVVYSSPLFMLAIQMMFLLVLHCWDTVFTWPQPLPPVLFPLFHTSSFCHSLYIYSWCAGKVSQDINEKLCADSFFPTFWQNRVFIYAHLWKNIWLFLIVC